MATWFLRISVLYLVLGTIFGWIIGITERLAFANVHAHVNLLGFATLALAGVIYKVYPAADNRLAVAHFWLQNVGLPIMMIGLFTVDSGNTAAGIPPTAIGSLIAILGVIVFAVNVWVNVPGPPVQRAA